MGVFDDPKIRAAIQRAIMDGVVVETVPVLTIRVPDSVVRAIEEIISDPSR